MPKLPLRRHGLEPFVAQLPQDTSGDAGVAIQLQADLGHINLRGSQENLEFVRIATSVLGQELPVIANTMSLGKLRIYWLGPNEWLILTSVDGTPKLVTLLREALQGQHAAVTELSGGQLTMRIDGPRVRDVLAKGCTLDFHPAEFEVGACAQSGLAKANILIGLIDEKPVFEIVVRRSFAQYLVLWLQHAATEYNVEFSVT